MKIRFKGNTIRYRLDQVDVKNVKETGYCHEKIKIGTDSLILSLKTTDKSETEVILAPFQLSVMVPSDALNLMIEGSETGFACDIPDKDGAVVKILIERDFKCLIPRGEDDKNAFENPLEGKASC